MNAKLIAELKEIASELARNSDAKDTQSRRIARLLLSAATEIEQQYKQIIDMGWRINPDRMGS